MNTAWFLGFDSSTQGLKAVAIDDRLALVYERSVNFDRDLPEFGTEGGAIRDPDGKTVTAPPLMWVAALDTLLERMRADGFSFDRVAAVSGSGQQHGSVWLIAKAESALATLNPERSLRDQLGSVFSLDRSPIWMDASTIAECRAIEEAIGGAQALADITGSRAYARFTGNQIAKVYRHRPEVYEATWRISLVSSFMASLFAGQIAPIDAADGSGMNLMDIRTRRYAPRIADFIAPDLPRRLGRIALSHAVVGHVHGYFVKRYGFASDCRIVAFSGDNPNSLAGLRLRGIGDMAVSLGTSDTLFGTVLNPKPSGIEGHVFANPVIPDAFMAMLVRQNGSLTRERVRDEVAGGSWETYREMMLATPPGNNGRMGLFIDTPEITPPILRTGRYRRDTTGFIVKPFDPAAEARAAIEGQFLSMRLHAEAIGLIPKRLIATGGASHNLPLLQTISDIFGVAIDVADCKDSAALGAAYRALHGWRCEQAGALVPFSEIVAAAAPFKRACEPNAAARAAYTAMLGGMAELERRALSA